MAVRPIDANAMLNELRPVNFEAEHSAVLLSDVSKMMREWVERQPTLTPQNEWVRVENALPPNMDDVLVVVQNNGECWTVTGYYSNTSNVWYAMLNGQYTKMDVLWWMPLPAPPDRRPPGGEEET